MTTTARITAQTTAAVYTASVAAGASAQFRVVGLVAGEEVVVLSRDSSAAYDQLSYLDEDGRPKAASMTSVNNSIRLEGPLDFRLSKSVTAATVEVVEYT